MPHLLLNMPIAQASTDSWLTAWLTPIWFLAAGAAMGLVVLLVLVALFRLLSFVPFWERLSHGPAGHVVAAIVTVALAAVIWSRLPDELVGNSELQEPVLLGIALVLLCSIVGWALVFCCSKQAAKNSLATLSEGAAGYIGVSLLVVMLIGGAAWGIGALSGNAIVADPLAAFQSIPQVFSTGKGEVLTELKGTPQGDGPFEPIELNIDFDLLQDLSITSNRTVILADADDPLKFSAVPVRLIANEELIWSNKQKLEELPIPFQESLQLHVQNTEVQDALLTIAYRTKPPVPEAATLLLTALCVTLVGLAILLQQAAAPRASAVALATVKNELAQPLFLVLMLLGVVAICLYEFLSFNTFGEDIKLLKDCGITTIMLLAAFQGIWSASSSISEEIEGKTALTVLSKPIQRRSFVIGKFLGIFWVLMLMFIILGIFEMGAVSYKPIYDARETSEAAPGWQDCHLEMVSTVPGLVMAFMQSVVLTAISVALATRLPQLANLAVCFAVYVIGNLTTSLVSSTQEGFEIVKFVASLIATIIPILEHFSLQAAIDAGNPITMSLLSGSLIYCLLYVLLAMFLALLLFEDRDLA